LLRTETDRVMALLGCSTVAALDRNCLQLPGSV